MTHQVRITYNVEAAMRDGTILRADVYQPDGEGPFPVILVRTPYDKLAIFDVDYTRFARAGYIVAAQDTRGSFASDGEWMPWKHERSDGFDAVEWAASLPHSNGNVGMLGPSYVGSTQWSAAISRAPHLRAIVPELTWSDPEDGLMFRGGAIELGLNGLWSILTSLPRSFGLERESDAGRAKLEEASNSLETMATVGYWGLPSGALPMLTSTGHPDIGPARAFEDRATTEDNRVTTRYDDLELPSLSIAGWFDVFQQGSLDNYIGMRSRGRVARVVVGPWEHTSLGIGGPTGRTGDVSFGAGSTLPGGVSLADIQLEWYRHWLTGEPAGEAHESGVLIFVMGLNQWRAEPDWPLARAHATPLYLDAGSALSWTEPVAISSDSTYTYDPSDPVLTRGGNTFMAVEFPAGPFDQRDTEARDDVLVFTSDPLTSDIEVTGRVRATLFAQTDGPSTDWIVRLCEVDSAGVSRNLVDGIARVRTEPGRVDEVDIDMWSTSVVVRAGHRLRVHVTSSNFPRWDRNLNTGEPETVGTTIRVATQRILHDRDHPSRVILPIIPA